MACEDTLGVTTLSWSEALMTCEANTGDTVNGIFILTNTEIIAASECCAEGQSSNNPALLRACEDSTIESAVYDE